MADDRSAERGSDHDVFDEIHRLVTECKSGVISDADFLRLQDLLHSDERARRLYVEHVYETSGLTALLHIDVDVPFVGSRKDSSEGVKPPVETPSKQKGRTANGTGMRSSLSKMLQQIHWHTHPVHFLAVVAAITLTVWLVFISFVGPRLPHEQNVASRRNVVAPEGSIAKLVADDGARWSGDGPSTRPAYFMPGQTLQLQAGLALIEFNSGASVILEGPATFVVENENAGRLSHGKLTASVTPAAHGFTIDTPTASVVDLGTEFGVSVDRDGVAEVVILAGSVELRTTVEPGSEQAAVRLSTGQAAVANRTGGIVVTAPKARFVRSIEYEKPPVVPEGFRSVRILNHSFEATALADNKVLATGEPVGWTLVADAGVIGIFNAGTTHYGTSTPPGVDGANVGFMFGGSAVQISQTLGDVLAANTTYQMTIGVGNRTTASVFNGYRFRLIADFGGGDHTILTSGNVTTETTPAGEFADVVAGPFLTGAAPAGLGSPLTILIEKLGSVGYLDIDNVRLEAIGPPTVPEPSTFVLTLLSLAGLLAIRRRR